MATRVLALGWEGLTALPKLLGVETAWYIIANDKQYPCECRSELARIENMTQCLANGTELAPEIEAPDFVANFERFKELYPDLAAA